MARVPIVQGGMGVGISLSSLSSAVANEGGIGVISTAGVGMGEADFDSNYLRASINGLRKEIRKARQATDGILGVNVMVALTNFEDMVRVAIEEGIDTIFSGAGLPLNLPKYATKDSRTKLVPIVSSGRAASLICRAWDTRYSCIPDAVVVEGPMAGGHLGFHITQLLEPEKYSLDILVTDIIAAVRPFEEKYQRKVPVIAAGGIYTGKDVARFLELGAAAVQMGTRFVSTDECDASIEFKRLYIDADIDDIILIESPVGLPGRAIKNQFLERVHRGEQIPFRCPYHCLKTCVPRKSPYCIARALINAKKGNLADGFAFAGQNAYRVDEIISVKELINTLVAEAENADRLHEVR